MTSREIRQKFLDFFESRGHKIVPSSSLLPDDPSVLLTTAGMQQFVPYFTGIADPKKDFSSRRVVSIQKAFRTSDIDEVGDETHLTFFEMLGHFSFGDYFKKETIEWTFEFLTKVLGVSKERISATVFAGNDKIIFDKESYDTWMKFLSEDKIKKGPKEDNVWGPAGAEGICGAANEVYVDGVEVATLVFMEYYCAKDGSLTPLPKNGVDVGWGFERVVMVVQDKENIFETDLFQDLIAVVPKGLDNRKKRISIDHARGIMFLIADGVCPGNKEAGYILRRLLRKFIFLAKEGVDAEKMFDLVEEKYKTFYSELDAQKVKEVFREERSKFNEALERGVTELDKLKEVDAKIAFQLFETFGIPFELIKELAGEKAKNLKREDFDSEFKQHQEISRAGAEKKFGGHGLLLNTGELKAASEEELKIVTRLHTATHLLQAALRKVLGSEVKQMGSDITAERTRFDFSFQRKITDEELNKVEDLVNDAISKKLPVNFQEMPVEEAKKTGALSVFPTRGGFAFGGKEKYPNRVKIYTIGPSSSTSSEPPFSREFCGGPHVKNTGEIGHFKIQKSESIGSGSRRIRGIIQA